MIEKTLNRMGGELYTYVLAKEKEEEILEFIIKTIDSLIDIFNVFDEKSLITKLNKERKVLFQEDLAFIIRESIEFNKISKGKFDIALGSQIKERKSNKLNLEKIKKQNNEKIIKISDENIEIIKPEINLDLGGIAKGYIIDKALEVANKKYPKIIKDIFIDARGDCVSFGKNKKTIDVENPFDLETSFSKIILKTGAIVTSGHNKQKYISGSHIIGEESDILTITLVSKTRKCYELDALATYLLQLQSIEVLENIEFNEYYKDIDCLIIQKEGNILKSSFWE